MLMDGCSNISLSPSSASLNCKHSCGGYLAASVVNTVVAVSSYGLSGGGRLEYIVCYTLAFLPAQNVMYPVVSSHSYTASGLLLSVEHGFEVRGV
jgi:hypothetical protein